MKQATSQRIIDSFGSLLDVAPTPKKIKEKHIYVSLCYRAIDDDVKAAWEDVAILLAQSYVSITNDSLMTAYMAQYQPKLTKIVDISSGIPASLLTGHTPKSSLLRHTEPTEKSLSLKP